MINQKLIEDAVKDPRKAAENPACVATILEQALKIKGLKPNDEDFNFCVREVTRKISQIFNSLTVRELGLLIDEGLYGNFGEYYGINSVTVIGWVQSYSQKYGQFRVNAAADYSRPALPLISETAKQEIIKLSIKEKFKNYVSTTHYSDLGGVVYNYLNRKGVINPSNAEKLTVYNKFFKAFLEQEKNKKNTCVMSFASAFAEKEKNAKNNAIAASKDWYVTKFFDSLIANNLSIEDYI